MRYVFLLTLILLPTTAHGWCQSQRLHPPVAAYHEAIDRIFYQRGVHRALCRGLGYPHGDQWAQCEDKWGECTTPAHNEGWEETTLPADPPRGTWQEETGEGWYQVFPGGGTVYCDRSYGCRRIMGVN